MANVHFGKTPYQRDLFGVPEEEVRGRFSGWKKMAHYTIHITVIVQIDTTNVSAAEYSVAPNLTFLSTNQALINIYQTWNYAGDWSGFNTWYAQKEASLQQYVEGLVQRLNSARRGEGLTGNWYVNYALDDRKVGVLKVGT